MDLAEIQAAYYMVAATGVLVAAAYYVLNMRQTIKTRQAQLFMPIYATYHSDEYLKAYSEIMKHEYSSYARARLGEVWAIYSRVSEEELAWGW